MDVRVGAGPMTATAEMGVTTAVVSILAIPVVQARSSFVPAPTRILSLAGSSLTAIPNPFTLGGASLPNAA